MLSIWHKSSLLMWIKYARSQFVRRLNESNHYDSPHSMLIQHAGSQLVQDLVDIVNCARQRGLKMLSIWQNSIKLLWLDSLNVDSTGWKSICSTFSMYMMHFCCHKYAKLATKGNSKCFTRSCFDPEWNLSHVLSMWSNSTNHES